MPGTSYGKSSGQAQSPRFLFIDPERAELILKDFNSFKHEYQEYRFEEKAELDFNFTNTLYVEIAKGMAQFSLLNPPHDSNEKWTGLKGLIKYLIKKIARPFIRLTLGQQEEMNRQSILLSQSVVLLEARVALLEQQLQSLTPPSR